MNYKSLIFTLSASALALASCNREEAWSGDTGYLTAEISQDFSVDPDKEDGRNHVLTLYLTDEAGQSLSKEITFHYSK